MKHLFLLFLGLLFLHPVFAAVNINTASESELQTLSGIGPSKAKAIVDHRTQHGAFKAPADIKNVKGIGDGIFKKIEAEIHVGTGSAKAAPKPATAALPSAAKPTANAKAATP